MEMRESESRRDTAKGVAMRWHHWGELVGLQGPRPEIPEVQQRRQLRLMNLKPLRRRLRLERAAKEAWLMNQAARRLLDQNHGHRHGDTGTQVPISGDEQQP